MTFSWWLAATLTCKSFHGTVDLFCEATSMGRAVEGGECGASWFVGQASRYLDDGLQTTGMVRGASHGENETNRCI